ncbi:hypothetical protein VM1G_11521 [Cytospora mali]|uniref:Uncharacterized protein n=1 Tax=Cytospora mali TaxID=578113 RepID=A0A194VUV0_CYTMA|nr:hypothetical protein VM1G_11521 [Valsa mali]
MAGQAGWANQRPGIIVHGLGDEACGEWAKVLRIWNWISLNARSMPAPRERPNGKRCPAMNPEQSDDQSNIMAAAGQGDEENLKGFLMRSSDVDSDTRRRGIGARDSTTDLNRIQGALVGPNRDAEAASAYEISR